MERDTESTLRSGSGPEDVFWEYVWGHLLDDHDRVAGNVHPDELALFKDQIVEGLVGGDPRQVRRHLRAGFGPDVTLADLRDMDAERAFVRFLRARAEHARARGGQPVMDATELCSCEVHDDRATIEWAALLDVGNDDVLLEKRVGLRRSAGRWWVLLDERIAGLGAQIRADLAGD